MYRTVVRLLFLPSLALLGAALLPGSAFAQSNTSNLATVTINATLGESLAITATPATVTIALNAGTTATTSSGITVGTTWLLKSTRSNINLYSWFTTAAAALTDGASTPNNIASSLVSGVMTTGTPTTYTTYTQSNTIGTASAGLLLYTQPITSSNRAGTRSDVLNLKVDLTTLPQLPAGTYTGTLNLQAQAL